MTYKNAAAGLNLGGGKALIWADPRTDKHEGMMRAFGQFLEGLGGRYITTEDVGSTPEDLVARHPTWSGCHEPSAEAVIPPKLPALVSTWV